MNKLKYDVLRPTGLFGGHLTQSQVEGCEAIVLASQGLTLSWVAYMLATAYWETAQTMQPIEEYGHGKGHSYGLPAGPWHLIYYGRGLVQETWYDNYVMATKRLHELALLAPDLDIAKNPELALNHKIASDIMVHGMIEGWFTHKKLSDYLPGDYVGARRIINGNDHAVEIAAISRHFEHALTSL